VYVYPIKDDLRRFKWKVAVRLDRSFVFLLPSKISDITETLVTPQLRASWLAGLVDSDGHVGIVRSGRCARFRVAITSSNKATLSGTTGLMAKDGYHFDGPYRQIERGFTTKKF
jgi:hypothetical protein